MNSLNEIINSFLIQSKTENLKWSNYPRDYLDLKMKVSFGQGVPARVTWISLLAPEMQTSKGYYPVYLFYKNEKKLILAYGLSETSEFSSSWPVEILENKTRIDDYIKSPPRYGDSFVFKSYNVEFGSNNKIIFTNDEGNNLSNDIFEKDIKEIVNYYKKIVNLEIKNEESPVSQGLFYMEKQLEDFIISNWENTKFGAQYDLIHEDGELISQQYPTDIGKIDILAMDKKSKNFVVIELKKNQTSDDTVGQLLRYMGWVKKNKNDEGVKGIIVAGQFDNKLDHARSMIPNCEVFLYEVDFKLTEFKV
tara:strand:+ start:126 stop:1046 length:921 start_codon:yes stop_codon:yes gene_type:complete